VDQWKAATSQLARLALNTTAADREQQLADLRRRMDQLEADLNLHSTDLRAQLQPVTLDAVQAAIPEDAALVEFVVFRPFDPRIEPSTAAYGPPHYAAYVLRHEGPPRGLDLGEAQAINQTIAAWRESLRDPARRDHAAHSRMVDAQVMRPLRDAIGSETHLLISPDGDLNLVPFDALLDEHGRYLIERYAISYLTSGRDLLRM